MLKGRLPPVPYRKFARQIAIGQTVVAIGLSPLLPLTAVAQSVAQAPSTTPGSSTTAPSLNLPTNASNIILPTDVLPLTAGQDRVPFGENMLLRLNQYLPSRFYFSSSIETSLRLETNPFQFPKKSILVRQLGTPQQFASLSLEDQLQIKKIIQQADSQDLVLRILPNVTGGWTVTPRTRLFANYFMIRDQLAKNVTLNTMIHSYAWGVQQDIPLGGRANLQAEMQFRELNQWHQQSVFDFLPGLTLSYIANPKTVMFVNALLQMRGKKYFQAPTKEIDPFYTVGVLHTRGGWTFAASTTFVQNFRDVFRSNATIGSNNYAFISDFEIARRLFRNIPGLQAFLRAEPIFNFASDNTPGLAGVDFRLFYGLRMAVAKPALTATMNNIIEQLRNQENEPAGPSTKPSAYLPNDVVAGIQQPIHGSMDGQGGESDPLKVIPASSVAGAVATIAAAESEEASVAPNMVAAAAEPVDVAKADWKPVIASLPDEQEHTLAQIHEQIAAGEAQSTVVAYDATVKRTDMIAARPAVEPKIDVAKANWDSVTAVGVRAVDGPVGQVDNGALLSAIESAQSETTVLAAEATARRVAAMSPPQPVIAKGATAGGAAVNVVQALAPTFSATSPDISAPVLKPSTALANVPVIAPKMAEAVISKHSEPKIDRVVPSSDSDRATAAPPVVATSGDAAAATGPVSVVPAGSASRVAALPPAPIKLADASRPGAEQLLAVSPVAAQAPPPPEPTPRAPQVAAAAKDAPKPAASLAARNASVVAISIPAPSHISADKSAMPKPISVAAAKQSAKPMTPTATVTTSGVLSAAVPPAATPATVAVVPVEPKPVASRSTAEVVVAPAVPPVAGQVAIPAPAVISASAIAGADAPPVVATVREQAMAAPSPAPVRLEGPQRPTVTDLVAVLPPATAPAPAVVEKKVDLLSSGDWDGLAQLSLKRVGISWRYFGDLRTKIDTAAIASARVLDYTVLNGHDRTKIAAKVAKPPSQEAGESHAVMFVPMRADSGPRSITADRPSTPAPTGTGFVTSRPDVDIMRSRGWHTQPSKSGHEAPTAMKIVPPLPTVRVNDKDNPFKGTGVDLKKPLMMSLPH